MRKSSQTLIKKIQGVFFRYKNIDKITNLNEEALGDLEIKSVNEMRESVVEEA